MQREAHHHFTERSDLFELRYHVSPAIVYPEEFHDTVQVCIPLQGAAYTAVRWTETGSRITSRLNDRDILFIPAGQPHIIRWHRRAGVVSLQLDSRLIEECAGVKPVIAGRSLRDPLLSMLAEEFAQTVRTEGANSSLYYDVFATLVAAKMSASHDGYAEGERKAGGLSRSHMRKIDAYIADHLDEEIALSDLAHLVGLSKWHFMRKFTLAYGTTPHRLVIERRLAHARQLLGRPSVSITEVALEVGMTQSHFSRAFLSQFGVSPREFRDGI